MPGFAVVAVLLEARGKRGKVLAERAGEIGIGRAHGYVNVATAFHHPHFHSLIPTGQLEADFMRCRRRFR